MKNDADFAVQWLDYLGNKIYNKGERLFVYDGEDPHYEISKLKSVIEVGKELVKRSAASYSPMPFSELDNLGFVIVFDTSYIWREKQKGSYLLKKKRRELISVPEGEFKRKRQIQHDPINRRIRIVGEDVWHDFHHPLDSGIGPWVVYDEDKPMEEEDSPEGTLTKEEYRARMKRWDYGIEDTTPTYQEINELPAIISDEGYIVCLQKQDTCQRIIVTGMSRKGKSVLTNALAGRIFYRWEDRMGWLIDPLNQFEDISYPQPYQIFNRTNAMIGNRPKPIPAIQLYLACKNKAEIKHENISLIVTLNFVEFLRKYKFYMFGLKDMDVGDTIRYINKIPESTLRGISSSEEIKEILFEEVPNADKDKGMQAMIYKFVNTFEGIFKERFTSNMYNDEPKAAHELEVRFRDGTSMKGHPFIMCYEAGVVPILNISKARRQRWLRNYLADVMQKIVAHQSSAPEGQKRRVWVIADELNEIYEVGKKKDNAYAAFEELYRQGAFNNIGFIGNTQSLDKLNPEMYKNATHICCFYTQDGKERKKVGEIFNVPKDVYSQIGQLEKLEVMIFSKEPFVIYDRWGRKRISKRSWFRGRVLPPINLHKMPPAIKGDADNEERQTDDM